MNNKQQIAQDGRDLKMSKKGNPNFFSVSL
jgi:hypothetical protein